MNATLRSKPWADVISDHALAVPTMLSMRERQLLYWLARRYVNGKGRIIDGGSFLGGSTAALANGLADRPDWTRKRTIAAYDLFRVEPYTLANFASHFPDDTIGASFRSAFDKNISPWWQHIEVNEGSILETKWSGEPIEVLFIDVAKSWDLNDFTINNFMPCLIAGHSIVIQQDYLWGGCPWLHITMELFENCFTVIDSMSHGSVAFLNTAPIPKEFRGVNLCKKLSASTKRQLMDQAVERWQGDERGLVELARVALINELDGVPAAQAEFASIYDRYQDSYRVKGCADFIAQHLMPGRSGKHADKTLVGV